MLRCVVEVDGPTFDSYHCSDALDYLVLTSSPNGSVMEGFLVEKRKKDKVEDG